MNTAMYFYFLNAARGKPVSPFVQNAIRQYEFHSLRTLMEKLDEHNLAAWTTDETRVIQYSIRNQDIINLADCITVERTDDGLLCLTRWEEDLMSVSEEDFIPKVLELLQQRSNM